MRNKAITWIISIILLMGPVVALPQNVTHNLEGTVVTRNGVPQRSAEVRFEGPATYISLTRADGKFFLQQARVGTYTVTVTRGNRFQRFTVRVNDRLHPAILTVDW